MLSRRSVGAARVSYMERRLDSKTVRLAVGSVVRVHISLGFREAAFGGDTLGVGRNELLLSDVLVLVR